MSATKRPEIFLAVVVGVMGGTSGRASALSTGSLAIGGRHACSLFAEEHGGSTPLCWGANDFGQASPPSGLFEVLTAGENHTCGLRADGSVVCWGDGSNGETVVPPGPFQQISAGDSFTCAIRGDHTVACWGKNDLGQSSPPTGFFGSISAGYSMACGIRDGGDLLCWGDTSVGPIATGGSVLSVAVGTDTVCALDLTSGTVSCWGDSANGLTSPPGFSPGTGPTEIAAGKDFFCASQGTLRKCWGVPNPPATQAPPIFFNQFGFGDANGCGVEPNSDGTSTVVCWGSNQDGQSTPPVTCPAGQIGTLGVSPCGACAAGSYSASAGSTFCSICNGGTYSVPGSSRCLNCPSGTFSQDGAVGCTPCAPGSSSPLSESGACSTCPRGQIAPSPGASQCTPCPTGLTSDPTSTQCVAATQVPAVPPSALGLLGLLLASLPWPWRVGRRRG